MQLVPPGPRGSNGAVTAPDGAHATSGGDPESCIGQENPAAMLGHRQQAKCLLIGGSPQELEPF